MKSSAPVVDKNEASEAEIEESEKEEKFHKSGANFLRKKNNLDTKKPPLGN